MNLKRSIIAIIPNMLIINNGSETEYPRNLEKIK